MAGKDRASMPRSGRSTDGSGSPNWSHGEHTSASVGWGLPCKPNWIQLLPFVESVRER